MSYLLVSPLTFQMFLRVEGFHKNTAFLTVYTSRILNTKHCDGLRRVNAAEYSIGD
jgi:hypothetical protein